MITDQALYYEENKLSLLFIEKNRRYFVPFGTFK